MQNAQKDIGAAAYQIAEMDKKEENFVQEIMTLERHIDHITRQLEDLHKHYNAVANERDQVFDELQTFKSIHTHQETNKTELQRAISRAENTSYSLKEQLGQATAENETIMAKLQFETQRYKDLEGVLVHERKAGHSMKLQIEDLKRQTTVLKQEADRHKLRVESKFRIASVNKLNRLVKAHGELLERSTGRR